MDTLEVIHRGMVRYKALDAKQKASQGLPFEPDAIRWYDDIKDAMDAVEVEPEGVPAVFDRIGDKEFLDEDG